MPATYALIHEENGTFGISFPDFPGCISTGRTAEEAIAKGSEALTFHVSGMAEDGLDLPVPRGLAELRADPAFAADADGATLTLINYEVPGRSVRINISIDENLLSSIDLSANASGESRSGWLADAARRRLQRRA